MDSIPPSPKQADQGWGAVVGIVIIVALLILGGVYFFVSGQSDTTSPSATRA